MSKQKSVKGTATEKNLVIAYLGESAAYTRYMFYAQQADKEEYYPVGVIFRETAANELRHAKVYFKHLAGGCVDVSMSAEAGVIGDTASNLACAAAGEEKEGGKLYIEAARVAEEEGFSDIAEHFSAIAAVERHHRDRFLSYEEQVREGTVWKREKPVKWQCQVCGYVHEGTEPPRECPACDHPYQHYMVIDEG